MPERNNSREEGLLCVYGLRAWSVTKEAEATVECEATWSRFCRSRLEEEHCPQLAFPFFVLLIL